ncbi:MAG: protein translocase subunit SecD, partial [Pseudomonadota bacterium]|nr:protein translocase subunit SecD [Pseudomonadota bacterium]
MNRYPLWKYIVIGVALLIGLLYTLPNFFGETPAVQVSPLRSTAKVDTALLGKVEEALSKANIPARGIFLDANSIKVRLADTDA